MGSPAYNSLAPQVHERTLTTPAKAGANLSTPRGRRLSWPSKCQWIIYSRLFDVEKVAPLGFKPVTCRSRNQHARNSQLCTWRPLTNLIMKTIRRLKFKTTAIPSNQRHIERQGYNKISGDIINNLLIGTILNDNNLTFAISLSVNDLTLLDICWIELTRTASQEFCKYQRYNN